MEKKTIFRLMSLVGIAFGGIGTLLSNWADNKELDILIDEKIDKKLSNREIEEHDEES